MADERLRVLGDLLDHELKMRLVLKERRLERMLVACNGLEPDEMLLVPGRKPGERFDEWARRCVLIKNIGEGESVSE
jgi:hypothetical protein